jgi:hypothetical protein
MKGVTEHALPLVDDHLRFRGADETAASDPKTCQKGFAGRLKNVKGPKTKILRVLGPRGYA